VIRYLLDAGPLSALLLNRPGAVSLIQPWIDENEATICSISIGEVAEYFLGRRDVEERLEALAKLSAALEPLTISGTTALRYALVRRQLRPPYGPGLIGDVDTIVAATAIEHDLILVTIDSDFVRVPALRVVLLDRRTFALKPTVD
jgi:predicted nucleic acid-binding protein